MNKYNKKNSAQAFGCLFLILALAVSFAPVRSAEEDVLESENFFPVALPLAISFGSTLMDYVVIGGATYFTYLGNPILGNTMYAVEHHVLPSVTRKDFRSVDDKGETAKALRQIHQSYLAYIASLNAIKAQALEQATQDFYENLSSIVTDLKASLGAKSATYVASYDAVMATAKKNLAAAEIPIEPSILADSTVSDFTTNFFPTGPNNEHDYKKKNCDPKNVLQHYKNKKYEISKHRVTENRPKATHERTNLAEVNSWKIDRNMGAYHRVCYFFFNREVTPTGILGLGGKKSAYVSRLCKDAAGVNCWQTPRIPGEERFDECNSYMANGDDWCEAMHKAAKK